MLICVDRTITFCPFVDIICRITKAIVYFSYELTKQQDFFRIIESKRTRILMDKVNSLVKDNEDEDIWKAQLANKVEFLGSELIILKYSIDILYLFEFFNKLLHFVRNNRGFLARKHFQDENYTPLLTAQKKHVSHRR